MGNIDVGTQADDEIDSNTAPSPDSPVSAPTESTDVREGRVFQYLSSVVEGGAATFDDPLSVESQALSWLQYEDPLALDPIEFENHIRLDQRYALLTMWFGSQFDWGEEENWLNEDECTWYGVTCAVVSPDFRGRKLQDAQVVVGIDMESNNVQGTISADLKLLEYLVALNLSKNQIEGTIPSTLSELEFLTELYLDTNLLTGNLQGIDFSQFQNLDTIDISENSITGEIPDSFWTMPVIRQIVMDMNELTGTISGDIGNLQALGKLN